MYIALKPCKFGAGHDYYIGDSIPDDVVLPEAEKRLMKMGIIAKAPSDTPAAPAPLAGPAEIPFISIPVYKNGLNENPECYLMHHAEVVRAVTVMQMGVNEAVEAINDIDNENVLILLQCLDSRKGVKTAAEKQAATIAPPNGDGE